MGSFDQGQLQLHFTRLHVLEPDDGILSHCAIFPGDVAILSEAIHIPSRLQRPDYGIICSTIEIHSDSLYEWVDVKHGLPHVIVWGECIFVKDLLQILIAKV